MWDSGSNVVDEIVESSLDPKSKLMTREQNSNVYGSMCVMRLLVNVRVFNFVKLKKADFSSLVI